MSTLSEENRPKFIRAGLEPKIDLGFLRDMFQNILKEEDRLFQATSDNNSEALKFVLFAYEQYDSFIQKINHSTWAFPVFFGQVRKHAGLAIMSTARRHHIQAMLCLRQVLEAGLWAAYGLATFREEDFLILDRVKKTADVPERLKNARNKWIEDNFKEGSDKIKEMKDHINSTTAHSNAIYAFQNFDDKTFSFNFFDVGGNDTRDSDFYFIGLALYQLLDIFYGVNKGKNVITISKAFPVNLKTLEEMAKSIKSKVSENG